MRTREALVQSAAQAVHVSQGCGRRALQQLRRHVVPVALLPLLRVARSPVSNLTVPPCPMPLGQSVLALGHVLSAGWGLCRAPASQAASASTLAKRVMARPKSPMRKLPSSRNRLSGFMSCGAEQVLPDIAAHFELSC